MFDYISQQPPLLLELLQHVLPSLTDALLPYKNTPQVFKRLEAALTAALLLCFSRLLILTM